MSHLVTIKTKLKDRQAVEAACRRLAIAAPTEGTADLYLTQATGLVVRLPGWRFPAVIDVASGDVKFDNFGGRWGEQEQLDRFLQLYAAEKAKIEARRKGYAVSEQALQDGSIRLRLLVGA